MSIPSAPRRPLKVGSKLMANCDVAFAEHILAVPSKSGQNHIQPPSHAVTNALAVPSKSGQNGAGVAELWRDCILAVPSKSGQNRPRFATR